jgi:hypothetical protein
LIWPTLPMRPLLEDYLTAFPGLGVCEALPVDLVADEYRARSRFAERPPSHAEYTTRFPQHGEALHDALSDVDRELDRDRLKRDEAAMCEPLGHDAGGKPVSAVTVHCPQCHTAVAVSDARSLTHVVCASCGSRFAVVGNGAAAQPTEDGVPQRHRRLGRFELLEQLGAGAFGVVWKARDTELGRVVVVKIPRRGRMSAVEDTPPRPRDLNPAIPAELETICLKCLERKPADRYATARDFADELRRYLGGDAIQTKPPTVAARTWRWCRRRPLAASLVLGTLLVLTAVTGGSLYLATGTPQVAETPKGPGGQETKGGGATPQEPGPPKPPTPEPKPAEEPPDEPVVTQGEPVDLLALVDTNQDTVNGDWTKDGDTLVCGAGLGFRVEVPYVPPDEYVLTVEAERLTGVNTLPPRAHLGRPAVPCDVRLQHGAGRLPVGVREH